MPARNPLYPLAFCLGALLLTLSASRLSADDLADHLADEEAEHLATVSEKLSHAGEDGTSLVPEHQQPCIGGMAAGVYPCSNIDLMEFMSHTTFGTAAGQAVKTNSLWGWTDPLTGHEWVLLGLNNGTAFIDITDPENPIYAGKLPSHNGIVSIWRDVREYQNYAYVVVDNAGPHGMQIFDLTQLRNVVNPPVTFAETAHYTGVTNTHTISINQDSGYAYLVGSNTCSGGLHILNLANPVSPVHTGCYNDGGYVHENQCFMYTGPDLDCDPVTGGNQACAGREICLAARGGAETLDIIDVSNHAAPVRLSSFRYRPVGVNSYSHQAWFTEDQRYILLNDELDEDNDGSLTHTYIFDALNLNALVKPTLDGYFTHATPAIDHNLYVRGNYVFQSNYNSGLRILELSNLANAELTEVGFFDLYPANNNSEFDGTWNNYPFFASGNIPASHISQGLFVLRPTNLCFAALPTPTGLAAGGNGTHRIDLDWSDSPTAGATFSVERALGGCGGNFEEIATGLTTSDYADLAASGVVTYGYRVRERNAAGGCPSASSTCVQASTTGSCTAAPAFAGATGAVNEGTAACSVAVSWAAGSSYCGGPTTYSVYRGATDSFVPSGANRIAQGLTGLAYADLSAPSLVPSFYVVRATDTASGGEETNLVHAGATASGPDTDGTFTSGAEPGEPTFDTLAATSPNSLGGSPSLAPEHAGWHLSSARKRTGTQSFYSVEADNACITLETPVTLTAGQSAELSFWTIWDIEDGFDGGIVEISTNGGGSWTRLTPNAPGYPDTISNGGNACGTALGNGTPAFSSENQLVTWQQRTVNLSAWAGQAVRLAWRYGTDGGVTGEGWYVDDIAITHAQVPGSCTSNVLLIDGFASGTTGAWSAAVP